MTYIFPLSDASPPTNNLLFNETSLKTFRRWFIETSLAKFVVENPAILLVTKAVVATLVELSLLDGVGTDTLPFNDTSPLTNIFPLNDTSPPTNNLLFNETSLKTFRRWFIETSLAKFVVENPAILLVTKAVVATLVELSLLDGVGTDTLPFNDTSPLTNIFLLKETSSLTYSLPFNDISSPIIIV